MGRHKISEENRRQKLSVSLSKDVLEFLEKIENRSAYVEFCLRKEMRRQQRKKNIWLERKKNE